LLASSWTLATAEAVTPVNTATISSFQLSGFSPTRIEIIKPKKNIFSPWVVFTFYFSESDLNYWTAKSVSDAIGVDSSDARFAYRKLASRLVREGFTVVLHDPLGVGCLSIIESKERDAPNESTPTPFCINNTETEKIIRSDFSELLKGVVETAMKVGGARANQEVIFFGHSAASVVVADYIKGLEKSKMERFGFVGMSPLLSSGASNQSWQDKDYYLHYIEECKEGDMGICVDRMFSKQYSLQPATVNEIKAASKLKRPDFEVKLKDVLDQSHISRIKQFNEVVNLNKIQTSSGGLRLRLRTLADMNFQYDSPAQELVKLDSKVMVVFGDADLALSSGFQASEWRRYLGRDTAIRILPGLGHALGSDNLYGPVSENGENELIDAIQIVARNLSKAGVDPSINQ